MMNNIMLCSHHVDEWEYSYHSSGFTKARLSMTRGYRPEVQGNSGCRCTMLSKAIIEVSDEAAVQLRLGEDEARLSAADGQVGWTGTDRGLYSGVAAGCVGGAYST